MSIEYRIVTMPDDGQLEWLNKLGAENWELVHYEKPQWIIARYIHEGPTEAELEQMCRLGIEAAAEYQKKMQLAKGKGGSLVQ